MPTFRAFVYLADVFIHLLACESVFLFVRNTAQNVLTDCNNFLWYNFQDRNDTRNSRLNCGVLLITILILGLIQFWMASDRLFHADHNATAFGLYKLLDLGGGLRSLFATCYPLISPISR